MNAPALNLLRYPRRMSWRHGPMPWLALVGFLLGGLGGAAWGLWSQSQRAHWQTQRQALQAQARQQAHAQARAAGLAQQSRLAQAAQRRQQAWHAEREQLMRWHERLEQTAADTGLRVQLWQGQAQTLQLQAHLPPSGDWLSVQARLNQAGPQDWQLQSLSTPPNQGLQLVLQTSWRGGALQDRGQRP